LQLPGLTFELALQALNAAPTAATRWWPDPVKGTRWGTGAFRLYRMPLAVHFHVAQPPCDSAGAAIRMVTAIAERATSLLIIAVTSETGRDDLAADLLAAIRLAGSRVDRAADEAVLEAGAQGVLLSRLFQLGGGREGETPVARRRA
jgi:hypothetical protein